MSSKKRKISVKTWLAFLLYFLIPLCALLLVLQSYPELPSDRMYMRIYWVIPTATVIVLLAQCSSFYQKGETRRFLLNLGFIAMTLLWTFGLLGGGIVMTTEWNEYAFSLHMDKYIILIVSVAALNMLYYTLEWRVYHKELTSSIPVEGKKIRAVVE
jgi:hypothetical protein